MSPESPRHSPTCGHCGATVAPTDNDCPECGEPLTREPPRRAAGAPGRDQVSDSDLFAQAWSKWATANPERARRTNPEAGAEAEADEPPPEPASQNTASGAGSRASDSDLFAKAWTKWATADPKRAGLGKVEPADDLDDLEELDALRAATMGTYDISGELGRGGMATVYLGHDIALDRKVAIKVMSPAVSHGDGIARFKREARTAASLSHPNIIPIYGVYETGRLLFFVMKYVQGRPLDSILREDGPLSVDAVQAILGQVGSAIGYAHRREVIHRDLKPANVMIDDEGWAIVTDFGIARVAAAEQLTREGFTVGTPAYMSPEQIMAQEVSGASDQYSLGIVAYEMLTGEPPFKGAEDVSTQMALMYAHVHKTPAPIESLRPDCPPFLSATIMRMLAKEASDRWPTVEDAVAALGDAPIGSGESNKKRVKEMDQKGSVHQTPRSPQVFRRALTPAPGATPARPAAAAESPTWIRRVWDRLSGWWRKGEHDS